MSEGAAKREEKPRKFQAVKGTRDILPPETALWNRVEQTAHQVFGTYGYGEVRLPIFEANDLFARSIGAETDVVSKEMYTFEDWPENLDDPRTRIFDAQEISRLEGAMATGELPNSESNRKALIELRDIIGKMDAAQARGRRTDETPTSWLADFRRIVSEYVWQAQSIEGHLLALRPEATASVCRAYIEHGMHTLPQPVKLYYMGPMFRRERPQKGRYRQFYQIGAEVLGGPDAPAIDAEVIEMVMTYFAKLGLEGATLYINSIGCKECRPKYVALLRRELEKVRTKLGPDSQRRIETNPLRVLDSKLEEEQAVIEKLPRISEHLCEDCRKNYADVKRELDLRGIQYQENWRLVRGLDYYVRTTFEITAAGLGSQNAVCGGGRYDGLVELLGGPPTKGTGFAIGEDRLILSLIESQKRKAPSGNEPSASRVKAAFGADAYLTRGPHVYIAWRGEEAHTLAISTATDLRAVGLSVEMPPEEQPFSKALRQADKLGAKYALILGENEISTGEYTLKTLSTGAQEKVAKCDLIESLKERKQQFE